LRKSVSFKFFLFFLLFVPFLGFAQIETKIAHKMDENRFAISYYISQFQGTTNNRLINQTEVITKIGLAKRVEFVGLFPFLKVTEDSEPISTFGDMILDLKFELKKGWYQIPFVQKNDDSRYFFDFYAGLNGSSGPKKYEYDGLFYPYATGLGDFRWGFLFGSYIKKIEYYLNFIYVYASYDGETFFPVSKSFWDTKSNPKVYFFNVHRIFLKFLWPGKAYGEYPMRDDYILYNINLDYWFEIKPILFKYKIFAELAGLQNFNSQYCLLKSHLTLNTGVIARVIKGGKLVLGASIPIIAADFDKPKFFFGIKLSL